MLREHLTATLVAHLCVRRLERRKYLMNFSTATMADKTTVDNVRIVIGGPRVASRTTTWSNLTHHRGVRGPQRDSAADFEVVG
jgi:hypothetical protein